MLSRLAWRVRLGVLASSIACVGKSPSDTGVVLIEAQARYPGVHSNGSSAVDVQDAGDLNGDGFDDIVIGSLLHASDQAEEDQLLAAVIYGSSDPSSRSLANPDASLSAFVPYEYTMDHAGLVAGVGDVNADGLDDLLVGSHDGAFVLFGSAAIGQRWVGDEDARLDQACCGAVAGGVDVTGDGIPDMLVGIGATAILLPGAAGLSGSLGESSIQFTDGEPYPESYSILDRGVAMAGDIDGDGLGDMLIGSRDDFRSDNVFSLVLGKPNLASMRLSDADLTVVGTDGLYPVARVGPAGDVNGDGYKDALLVYDHPYLCLGSDSPDWPDLESQFKFDHGQYGAWGVGDTDGDGFDDVALGNYDEGAWLAYGAMDPTSMNTDVAGFVGNADPSTGVSVGGGGDVNADGLSDWLVGALLEDEGDIEDAGATYLLLGEVR